MKENKIIDVCEKYSKKLKKFRLADKKVCYIKSGERKTRRAHNKH